MYFCCLNAVCVRKIYALTLVFHDIFTRVLGAELMFILSIDPPLSKLLNRSILLQLPCFSEFHLSRIFVELVVSSASLNVFKQLFAPTILLRLFTLI